MISAHSLLVEGRKLLADGWVKGVLRTRYGESGPRKFCLMGCVIEARDQHMVGAPLGCELYGASDAALNAIRGCIEQGFGDVWKNDAQGQISIAKFNDAEGRTHEDVLAVIDCAIKRTETELTQEVGHGG